MSRVKLPAQPDLSEFKPYQPAAPKKPLKKRRLIDDEAVEDDEFDRDQASLYTPKSKAKPDDAKEDDNDEVTCKNPRLCYHGLKAKPMIVKTIASVWYGQKVHVCAIDGFDGCDFWEPDESVPSKNKCMCGKPPRRGVCKKVSDSGVQSENFGRWFMTCAYRKCRKFGWLATPAWKTPEVEGASNISGEWDE